MNRLSHVLASTLLTVIAAGSASAQAALNRDLPPLPEVREFIARHFAAKKDYQPGDIISQSDVKPLLEQLKQLGWSVRGAKSIIAQLPGDRDFVVDQLRTDRGTQFMRKVSQFPAVYDRLYRMSSLHGGRRLVADLIQARGGEELIEYLTMSDGGKQLGAMLGKTARGANFDQPLDRLFTEEALTKRLVENYEQELLKSAQQ